MVHYKLIYFNFGGRGEAIRMLFHYMDQKFEDFRYEYTPLNWPKSEKDKYPYGQLPVLVVDGNILAQTFTISEYLGEKFGLAGKNEWEKAKASEYWHFYRDVELQIQPYLGAKMGFMTGNVEKLRDGIFVPSMRHVLPLLEKILADSGSGFLLPSGPSYADFYIGHELYCISQFERDFMDNESPKVVEYMDHLLNLPEFSKYKPPKYEENKFCDRR